MPSAKGTPLLPTFPFLLGEHLTFDPFVFCPWRQLPHGLHDPGTIPVREDLAGLPGLRTGLQGSLPFLSAWEEERCTGPDGPSPPALSACPLPLSLDGGFSSCEAPDAHWP